MLQQFCESPGTWQGRRLRGALGRCALDNLSNKTSNQNLVTSTRAARLQNCKRGEEVAARERNAWLKFVMSCATRREISASSAGPWASSSAEVGEGGPRMTC
jgi:hypothetical protein